MGTEEVEVLEVLEEVFGEHGAAVAAAFAEVIEAAHSVNPEGWEVTLEKNGKYLRVNAGAIVVADVYRDSDELTFAVVREGPALPRGVVLREPFRALPTVALAEFSYEDVERVWPKIRDRCLRATTAAAARRGRIAWFRAHSQDAVDALGEMVGRELPSPDYLGALGGDSLEELFHEFRREFATQEAGTRHFQILSKSRVAAREILERIRRLEAQNADLTSAVLDGVLPHVDTANNRSRGAWISLAPAVTKDIRSWFEGSGYFEPGEWPEVARALWRLVSRATSNPAELAPAIEEFQGSGLSKGFQAGMVTPFLNAVDPESFAIFNSKSRKVLNHFADTAYSPDLASYPEANQKILEWCSERRDLFRVPEIPSLRPHEAFDMFSHWLVAVRRYFKGKGDGAGGGAQSSQRIWKISPGANAEYWEEWRREGFVAIGWDDLGDLTHVTKQDFEVRVGEVVAEHQGEYGWSRAGLLQTWKFRNLQPGDIVVANRGTREVLGIGRVVGPYRYERNATLSHRVSVDWVDTNLRRVSKSGWKKTLIELEEEELNEILASEEVGPLGDTDPVFDLRTFELLAEMAASPTKETYARLKVELKSHVEEPLQFLFKKVVSGLPASALEILEVERGVYSRFLKNDYGKGWAWPYLWAAAYTKGSKRTEAAQLYISVLDDRVDAGFYVGAQGRDLLERFSSNVRAQDPALTDELMRAWEGLGLTFGERSQELAAGAGRDARTWWRSLADSEELPSYELRAARSWGAEEARSIQGRDLINRIRVVFAALLPMILLSSEKNPSMAIRRYLGHQRGAGEAREVEAAVIAIPKAAARNSPVVPLNQVADEVHLPESLLRSWVESIERKGQAILYGPPGTGKTFVARKLASHLVGGGDGFVDMLQFHPSYAYEDFIQGLRPVTGEGGSVRFEVIDGRFLEFCQRAEGSTGTCVLILDEINRANLSRVFGELMYLLEYRGDEVVLAGGRRFSIPGNVRLIGTMNTADRSIALVDHALRRRFAFLALRPVYDVLSSHFADDSFSPEGLITVLKKVNEEIADSNYSIGISFFLVETPAKDIEAIWRMEIEPYLEELFFDQPRKLEKYRWEKVSEEILAP